MSKFGNFEISLEKDENKEEDSCEEKVRMECFVVVVVCAYETAVSDDDDSDDEQFANAMIEQTRTFLCLSVKWIMHNNTIYFHDLDNFLSVF